MNIYEYAKENNADYYDPNTGYVYKVQDYNIRINNGLPTAGIAVYKDSEFLGFAIKK